MDALSAVFVLLISVVGAVAAVFGYGYLGSHGAERKKAVSWCWYNLLLAAMLLVVAARDGFLFLVAWELMSLTSFFLVVYEGEKESVVRAGWTYLIATHVGTAFLLVMFLLLGQNGRLDFSVLSASGSMASAVFICALIGFGTKAGLVPLHIWLPEAHPAAPSHVSALMSGVMIKTGIYGLLRVLSILGSPAAWWGWTLVGIGVVSGIIGVLMAVSKHDLKRLLAYSSVENIGIITLSIGLGVLGMAAGHATMAVLGLCGGLLHVVNHGIFKSLLFMGAGAVLHATGTRQMDHLGGLLKRMPVTGAVFLVGSAAICALPPLNGFASELLVYAAAFSGVGTGHQVGAGWIAIAGLALIGGLAVVGFTKAFGIVFLGQARNAAALEANESSRCMRWSLIFMAFLCAAMGLGAPAVVAWIWPAAAQVIPAFVPTGTPDFLIGLSARISLAALVLIGLTTMIVLVRARLMSQRPVHQSITWDCGYAAPSARMQYTSSSFIQPVLTMFRLVLRTQRTFSAPKGYFPSTAELDTRTPDIFAIGVWAAVVQTLARVAMRFRHLIIGRTHLYILYIVVTLLLLLIWNLW
jgi:formate hydrogenlyase subunit 3/multisubunit Na+/H+ antiporter MnhD subunit